MQFDESKITIYKSSDGALKKYRGLVKMTGIQSKGEKEIFELVQKELARRKLMNTLNSTKKKKKALNENIPTDDEMKERWAKFSKEKEKYDKLSKKILKKGALASKEDREKAYQYRYGVGEKDPYKEEFINEEPTNAMGMSSSTQGPIQGYDPLLGQKKRLLKRFKDVIHGKSKSI